MQQYYKLFKVRELADGDEDFIVALAQTFLEEVSEDLKNLENAVKDKVYDDVCHVAHKMKPTIDLFELGILDALIKVQDWGRLKQSNVDISNEFHLVVTTVNNALVEIKSDFNL